MAVEDDDVEDRSKKPILVTGATGRQGGAVVRHLLESGWPVVGFTRNPDGERAAALEARGASVASGDLDDPASLRSAMEGIYGVFSVQDFWQTGITREIVQGKNVVDAAQVSGVRHLVYSSVASADRATGLDHFETKHVIEQYIWRARLPATILRPVGFMENYYIPDLEKRIRRGRLADPIRADKPIQLVAVDDIGKFAALAFDRPGDFIGRTIEIAGDEKTNPQIAAAFSLVMRRPVKFQKLPMWVARFAMGKEVHKMFRWYNKEGYRVDIGALKRDYPEVELTTLEAWLEAEGWSEKSGSFEVHDKTYDTRA